jgi:DNA modification methylase
MAATDPQSNLRIEHLALTDLALDPENARVHKPAQIRQIAASIEAFGYNVPILVDRDGKVLAGHGRVLALRRLRRTQAPVIRLEHLTPAQARAFSIAENRLVETSAWNERLLAQHFKVLSELDLSFSLEATGFSMGEIDLKIEGLADVGGDADDQPLAPAAPAVTRPGDLWSLGRNRVLCASALDTGSYTRLLGDERPAMVFTDPPYNVPISGHVSGKGKRRHREFLMGSGEFTEPEFTAFLTTVCRLMAGTSMDGALHYICMDWRHLFALMAAGRASYDEMVNLCVWSKTNAGMGGLYRSAHELVLIFKKGQAPHRNNVQLGKYGRNRTNVWSYPGANVFLRGAEDADLMGQHPTPKPVQMIADALLDASARGDVVLDPFGGSGSTLLACERVGRAGRLMELDPLYVDLTVRRWIRMTAAEAIREADGRTFAQIEKAAADAG